MLTDIQVAALVERLKADVEFHQNERDRLAGELSRSRRSLRHRNRHRRELSLGACRGDRQRARHPARQRGRAVLGDVPRGDGRVSAPVRVGAPARHHRRNTMTEYVTKQEFTKQKARLTRANNSGDPLNVLKAVEDTVSSGTARRGPTTGRAGRVRSTTRTTSSCAPPRTTTTTTSTTAESRGGFAQRSTGFTESGIPGAVPGIGARAPVRVGE